jgi:probable phosphoglycerate mutase
MLLVRHGQSVWNAQGKWQGQADIELSELGRLQARAAAKNLGSFDIVAASPLLRAMETAEIVADSLGIGPIMAISDLVERNAGEWSGLTRADIERDWPGYLANEQRPPSYESDDDMYPRVARGLQQVAEHMSSPDDEAIVFAHGGLVYLLESRAGRKSGRLPNLGAVWLTVDTDGEIDVGERIDLIDEADLRSAQSSDIL